MTTKKSLKKDEQAVSPVIAVIMLIAITVVIAAVVAAFAYGIIGGVKKAPNCALVVDGANRASDELIIIHHGGDTIVDAFAAGSQIGTSNWSAMEMRINGAVFEDISGNTATTLNDVAIAGADDFEAGDELAFNLTTDELQSGDSIAIVFTPTGDLLQRVTVT